MFEDVCEYYEKTNLNVNMGAFTDYLILQRRTKMFFR